MRWFAAGIVSLAPTVSACGRVELAARTDADAATDADTDDAADVRNPNLRLYMPFDGNADDVIANHREPHGELRQLPDVRRRHA